MNSGPYVNIKGVREGLLVTVTDGDYAGIHHELAQALAEKGSFLRGSQVILSVGDLWLDEEQLAGIQTLLATQEMHIWGILTENVNTKEVARTLGLATRRSGSQMDLAGKNLAGTVPQPAAQPRATDHYALVIKETLRSGRAIEHSGTVVIVGDVNPGAQIIAAGDVLVWGKLRGLVHAGAYGDRNAIICALELNPTQLRIADQIAISPDDAHPRTIPERAIIRDGQIVAEPWNRRTGD